MALTKVTGDFIKDGVLTQAHLHSSHGITSTHIGEGDKLFFTNARARGAITVSGNALSYNSSTGVITSNFEESPTFTGTITATGGSANNNDDANILTLNASQHARLLVDTSSTSGHRATLALESNGNELLLTTTGSASELTSVGNLTVTSSATTFTGNIQTTQITATNGLNYLKRNTDASLQLRSENTRSGLFITKPATDTVMGSALVLADESYRLGTASYYHMVMLQNGNTYFNQKVGIGTTSPTHTLHVKNSSGDVRGIMIEQGVTTSYAELAIKSDIREFRLGTAGNGTNNANAENLFYIYDATTGGAAGHRFEISSAGDVQARRPRSNTAGDVALSVQPTDSSIHYGFRIDSSTNSFNLDRVDNNTTHATFNADRTTTFAGNVHVDVINNAANSANIIYRSGTSTLVGGGSSGNKLYVLDSGNVGIGTTSPASLLHIQGSTYNRVQTYFSGSYISGFKFSDLNGGIWYDAGTDDLYLNANHANSQVILQSGGSTTLTLDASNNATFAGGITAGGAFSTSGDRGNSGFIQTWRNTNTGTGAYVEHVIGSSGSSELRVGHAPNYGSSDWNASWVYAVGKPLFLKSSSNDVVIYAGGAGPSDVVATFDTNQNTTFAGNITASGVAGDGTPLLTLTGSASATFNWISKSLHANLTAGEANIHLFGKAASSKNSGYIGYNWAADASNNNYVSIGHYSANHLFRVYGDQVLSTVTLRGDTDIQAPIFYDKNNTGYYVNPNSSSNLLALVVQDNLFMNAGQLYIGAADGTTDDSYRMYESSGAFIWQSRESGTWTTRLTITNAGSFNYNTHISMGSHDIDYVNQLHFSDNVRFLDEGNDSFLRFQSGDGNTTGIKFYANSGNAFKGYVYGDSDGFGLLDSDGNWSIRIPLGGSGAEYRSNNNIEFTINDDHTLAHGSSRAPLFYDSNNTSYYLDPDTTGDALKIKGSIRIDSTHSGGNLFLYYEHTATDVANSGTLTGWVSEPGISYSNSGIGGNIHQSGPYYGRSINSGYGVYIEFDKGNGQMYFKTTTGTSGTSGGQGATRMSIDPSGNVIASGSSRAPIFYDSADTSYYVDANATSNLYDLELTGSKHTYLYINPGTSNEAMVRYNGGTGNTWYVGKRTSSDLIGTDNFHFYAQQAGATVVGIDYSGNILTKSTGSVRSPIFYDSNDTGYYLNPASTSVLNGLTVGGNTVSGFSGSWMGANFAGSRFGGYSVNGGEIAFLRDNPSGGKISVLVDGSYYAGENGGFWSIWSGNNYNNRVGIYGDSSGNLNIGTSASENVLRTNHGYIQMGPMNSSHAHIYTDRSNFYFNKQIQLLGGSLINQNDIRAGIFYDANNTAYYVDPASTGILNNFQLKGTINLPASGLATHSSGHRPAYGIYQEGGSWSHPFPDLCIAMHTGIKMGANASYGGIRFYNDYQMSDGATELMSINNSSSPVGSSHVYVNNILQAGTSLRAPYYYDSDNTAYYINAASTSVINGLTMAGALQTAGSHTVGSSGTSNIYMGGVSGNYFRFHTNNSHTYFDGNVGDIHWRQGSSTRFIFYMTTANMTVNGTVTQNSDERIKENIITIDSALNKVNQLRGVYYNRTDINTSQKQIGLIAQEVENVIPEVVLTANDELGTKSISYGQINALLIEAIKEQQTIIDDLKSRIETLENQ